MRDHLGLPDDLPMLGERVRVEKPIPPEPERAWKPTATPGIEINGHGQLRTAFALPASEAELAASMRHHEQVKNLVIKGQGRFRAFCGAFLDAAPVEGRATVAANRPNGEVWFHDVTRMSAAQVEKVKREAREWQLTITPQMMRCQCREVYQTMTREEFLAIGTAPFASQYAAQAWLDVAGERALT